VVIVFHPTSWTLKLHDGPKVIATDRLKSHDTAMIALGKWCEPAAF
jgi:hypothetical protein